MHRWMIAGVLACFPAVGAGQGFTAENWLTVIPLSDGQFEVVEARGEGPRGIWCAAADFADTRLKVPGAARVYISRERGPSVSGARRKSVVFTTDPADLSRPPFQSASLSTSQVGMGLPINHAIQFCRDYSIERFDGF